MEFKIENTEVYGLNKAIIASGNAMRIQMDDNTKDPSGKDYSRASKLGNSEVGAGHDNFLNGVIVQFDVYAPLAMWKQIQRYHFLDFVSSQSTMHKLTQFNIKECCVSDVDPRILDIYQEMLDDYNSDTLKNKDKWRKLVMSLPCGFVLGATMTTNYRQLKTIYFQRKNHKLKEWHEFCKWIEQLPQFKELCLKDED